MYNVPYAGGEFHPSTVDYHHDDFSHADYAQQHSFKEAWRTNQKVEQVYRQQEKELLYWNSLFCVFTFMLIFRLR